MKIKPVFQKRRSKLSWDDKIFMIVVYAVLAVIMLACLYPMYYTVIASLSDPYAVYTGKVSIWVEGFSTKAYEFLFENSTIWRGYANSIFYTFFGTLFNLFLTVPAAYALSKKRMFGHGAFTTFFLISMYFGGGMIPYYLLLKNLNLLNTPYVLIITGGVSVYNMIVTRTYFQNNIPDTLCEAARIDGASELSIFFRIALPLSMPIIAVITLYYAVGHWNSYFNGMIYVTDTDLQPLQVVLRRILILNEAAYEEAMASDAGDAALMQDMAYRSYIAVAMKYAVVFISSLPMLMIYPLVQKHFVKGVMVGSLKG